MIQRIKAFFYTEILRLLVNKICIKNEERICDSRCPCWNVRKCAMLQVCEALEEEFEEWE